jgi:hypothetical protein
MLITVLSLSGTREWVFDDLSLWLHNSSPVAGSLRKSDSYDSDIECDSGKIWLLQSPAGFGKSVVAAAIADKFKTFLVAKHFAKFGNPPSINANSFCLSIAHQLNSSFDKAYKRPALAALSSLSEILVEKICHGCKDMWEQWGKPFLVFLNQQDYNAIKGFFGKIRLRMDIYQKNLDQDAVEFNQTEFTVLFEIFSSFQIVYDEETLFVVPHVHLLQTVDLFDALISQPLLALPTSGETKCLLFDGLDCVFGRSSGCSLIRLIRLIALRSPSWLRLIITSRGHNDELSKEFDGSGFYLI